MKADDAEDQQATTTNRTFGLKKGERLRHSQARNRDKDFKEALVMEKTKHRDSAARLN